MLYQTPTFMILRASSAVATLRPNSSQIRTTPSICLTEVARWRFAPQMLSSLPTRTCCPRTSAIADSEINPRILDQKVATAPCGTLTKKLHPVERIAAERAAAVARDRHIQRPHIDACADQPLDDLNLVDMCRHKVGLNPVLAEPLEVLEVEGRGRVDHHPGPRGLHLRIVEVRPLDILFAHHRDDVPLRVPIATVTNSGFGSSSVSMWRVS